ncbi:hypothetical protein BD779DRAFT_107042 [Infundibulicybe gibba]|nr:hypothetical protein BD779DRAFT_107042 [Infundibulicybe gibba]
MCWPRILRLSLSFLFLSVRASNAVLVNQTIDDSLGDSLTGSKVQYSPSTDNRGLVWKSQDACDDCAIVPNLAKAHNNTWNSATNFEGFENITATFHFSGTAIYVYFIIPDVPFGPQIINSVDCDFLLDDQFAGHYTHTSDGSSGFQYHALVYHNTGLNNTPHTFMIQVKGTSVVIFDYAKYTFDTPAPSVQSELPKTELPKSASAISPTSAMTTTTSATSKASAIVTLSHPSKPAGTIAGGTIAGIVGITLIVLGIILYRRRTLRRTLPNGSPTTPPGSSPQMRRGDITPPMQAQTEFERQSSDSYQEAVALHSWGGYQSPGFLNGQIAAAAKLETSQDTELLKG